MGKTKTALVSEPMEKKKEDKKAEKVHIGGLKGGQRIKMVEATPIVVEEAKVETPSAKKAKRERVRSKKYQEAKAKIDRNKRYELKDAIDLIKQASYSKFDGTMELHLVVKKTGLSANVTLPHSAGKQKRVEVAGEATIKKLATGKIDFDVLLATAEMMPKLRIFLPARLKTMKR